MRAHSAHGRTLLALVAAGLALAGGLLTELERRESDGTGYPPALSWALFALAAAALTVGAAPGARRILAPIPARHMRPERTQRVAVLVLVAGLALSLASAPLFLRLNDARFAFEAGWAPNNLSWRLYITALACFVVGVVIFARGKQGAPDTAAARGWPALLSRRTELAIAAVLTGAALALRLPALGTIPRGFWLDEGQNGIVGRELLAPNALHPVFVGGLTEMGSLYYYLVGGLVELAGSSVWVVRLLPALAGSLTAPLLYFLASRLYGWRVGLVAGSLVAFSSWSITFSRFGMASMVAVALDVAVVLCVVLGLRSGRLAWYAAGGLILGVNLQGYFLARLMPVVLLLLVIHLAVTARHELWRARWGIAVFGVAAVLAFLPMGLFAIQHPSEFQGRPSTVSIFSEDGSGGEPNAVWKSLRAHVLMFGYRGDFNGRHNLPGSPMLDWLTAALFVAGVGACLLRIRRWEYFFPLVWLATALSAGVFTYLGEAPQSHRTLENSVVAPLIAGIFAGEIWGVVSRGVGPRSRVFAATAMLFLVTAAAVMNIDKYFGRQVDDPIVWSDMGADKTVLANLVREHAKLGDVWVSDILTGQPAVEFLIPNVPRSPWTGAETLPFVVDSPRDVLLALSPTHWTEMAAVQRLYPNARFEAFQAPNHVPLLYTVRVPARDIAATRGVVELSSQGTTRRRSTFTTPGGGKDEVRLVATVKIRDFGRYRFAWSSRQRGAAVVVVDGRRLGRDESQLLSSGLHLIEVITPAHEAGSLSWATRAGALEPLPADVLFDPRRVWPVGLEGLYRRGKGFGGTAQLMRRDPLIGTYFHTIPLPPPFTVEWRGELYAPAAGRYLLGTKQVDTASLYIDGHLHLINRQPTALRQKAIHLAAGWHKIRIRYRALTGSFQAYLYWTPPGRPSSIVPSAFLRPSPLEGYPTGVLPKLEESGGELSPGSLSATIGSP